METKTMTRNLIAEYSILTSLQTYKTITYTMILSLLIASKFHNFKQVKTEAQKMKAKAWRDTGSTDRANAAQVRKDNQSLILTRSPMDK